ncbi:galactose-1-phosphate uridylyltransferase [[Eubacterium] cellulosolvens]
MADKEIIRDPFKDRWILFSIKRGKRISVFNTKEKDRECVFCPGNEHLTPAAVLLLQERKGKIEKKSERRNQRIKNWLIRVIPNLYPAVRPDLSLIDKVDGTAGSLRAVGHHEIIIESPRHHQRLERMSLEQLQNILSVYRERVDFLSQKDYVRYISVFRNYRREAGASQSHPHSQLITLPFIPSVIMQEIERFRIYLNKGECILCDLISKEGSKRVIWKGSSFTVLAPWFSASPYEVWIIPNRHMASYPEINREEILELSAVFHSIFESLSMSLNDPPHNFWIHNAPSFIDNFHWHIEIIPKTGEIGGLEQSTAVYINPILPEATTRLLRPLFLRKIEEVKG